MKSARVCSVSGMTNLVNQGHEYQSMLAGIEPHIKNPDTTHEGQTDTKWDDKVRTYN